MRQSTKIVISSTLAVATLLASIVPSTAHDHRYYGHHHRPAFSPAPPRHHDHTKNAVIAGVLGLAAGAIIGSTLKPQQSTTVIGTAQPWRNSNPAPSFYAGPSSPNYAPPANYYRPHFTPWSAEWYQYCSIHYRSFNPRTGTYVTFEGETRFCNAN